MGFFFLPMISLILFSADLKAEYRVFSIIIVNADQTKTRQIETTLDPAHYVSLFPLNKGENIGYVDTWICKGRTDWLKPHCENPKNLNTSADYSIERLPAAGLQD